MISRLTKRISQFPLSLYSTNSSPHRGYFSSWNTIFPPQRGDAYRRINRGNLPKIGRNSNGRLLPARSREEREDRCLLCCKPRIVIPMVREWCEGCIGGSPLLVRHSVVRDDHFRHAWARSPFKRYYVTPVRSGNSFPRIPDFSRTPAQSRDFVPSNSTLAKNCDHFPATCRAAFVRFRFNESSVRVTMRPLKWMLLFDKTRATNVFRCSVKTSFIADLLNGSFHRESRVFPITCFRFYFRFHVSLKEICTLRAYIFNK